jgi:hypothetical protein
MDGKDIRKCYQKWLLKMVLIECWTVQKCAKFIGRDPSIVQRDFDSFLKERAKG